MRLATHSVWREPIDEAGMVVRHSVELYIEDLEKDVMYYPKNMEIEEFVEENSFVYDIKTHTVSVPHFEEKETYNKNNLQMPDEDGGIQFTIRPNSLR